MQQTEAQAIERNIYHIPAGLNVTGAEVEQRYVKIVESVTGTVTIPVAVKLSPYFSAMGRNEKNLDVYSSPDFHSWRVDRLPSAVSRHASPA